MAAGPPQRRPNILLVIADQLAAAFLPVYGGPAITPALDRLAADGVVFESAYSNSPLCAPARFAMMSGQLNSKIGAYDNASEFASSIPTFAHSLRSSGYQTSLIGKMHFVGADQLHGFEDRLTTDIYPADFGWTPNWADPDGRFDWWFHNMDSVTNAGIVEASNQLDYDDEVGHQAIRKLRDLARSTDERPWFVTVSFTHPHDPYVTRGEFWDRYDHDAIPLPIVGPLAPDAVDPHSRRLSRLMSADTTPVTDRQVRTARHAYLANISYVDDFVAEIMSTIERLGMGDDTVVIFTADHGDMLGERGLWYKMNYFEHSARIPMILRAPGRVEAGRVSTPTSLLDIAPTLLDVADATIPETFDGDSLFTIAGRGTDPDRTVVGEYLGEGAVAPIFLIRRGNLKFVWCEADPAQLYDLDADPHELVNLASDPAHAAGVTAFEHEVFDRWDPPALRTQVIANQRARADIDRALRQGRFESWDYQPTTDARNQYMRNHLDLNEVESGRRI
jgi:choline-sulfatase